ncbi:MAG TPA: R3H domain-containing nucleic acid-binding protein [Flexilinea sp.]|nr:R3H domain-containing nucleic acid-binding protein [Flexilinea sp.]HOW07236.1 R3H domain-containing nucleic acid-binding protein [Flexilinea sp.]HPS48238.1 R3H domain-containing nucleic acid-binding protein [Flexilinea sp.]
MKQYENNLDDIHALVAIFPEEIGEKIESIGNLSELVEVVFDVGRPPLARYTDDEIQLSEKEVGFEDLETIISQIGDFDLDNRAGMERTLHRISAIRNRKGKIIGLTCRVGRAVFGTLEIIQDFVDSGKSILILGKPGIGKTTMLREAARVLAEKKRVVIVDTSNEIGGDGDVPHPAVGKARRLQVAKPALQHEVMIEAVENHNPEVIVIDEIGRELEAQAARTIAERGVQLIGTAHGRTLSNLLMNPTLSDLVGGIESVTLSDEEARRRGTQKTVLERRSPPTFDVLVEIVERNKVVVYPDVAAAVDALVRGIELAPELRIKTDQGKMIREKAPAPVLEGNGFTPAAESDLQIRQKRNIIQITGRSKTEKDGRRNSRRGVSAETYGMTQLTSSVLTDERDLDSDSQNDPGMKPIRIYPHGVARNRLEQASARLGVLISIVNNVEEADVLMTLRPYYRSRQKMIVDAEERNVPIYVLRSNTINQIEYTLANLFNVTVQQPSGNWENVEKETTEAIMAVKNGEAVWVDLAPANRMIRQMQHELVEQYGLLSQSYGKEPKRRIRIFQNPE